MQFNVNTDEVVKLSNKLEKLHRSALPIAVRGTLNDVAFLTRKESLRIFRKKFVVREKDFYRSHAVVNKSPNTFNINQMYSEMGVLEGKTNAGNNLADLEKGATKANRDIPINPVRYSGSSKMKINKSLYKKIYKNKPKGRIYKSGEGTIIKTKDRLLRVLRGSIWKTLYVFNETVKIKKQPFIEPSGLKASKNIDDIFYKQAKRQIEKYT